MRAKKLAAALSVAMMGVLVAAVGASAQTYTNGTTTLPSTGTGADGRLAEQFPTIALVAVAVVVAMALVGGAARRIRAN